MIIFSGIIWEWSKEQIGLNKCSCLIINRIRIVQNQKYFLLILGQNKSYFLNRFKIVYLEIDHLEIDHLKQII